MPEFLRLTRAHDEDVPEGDPLVFMAATPGVKRDGVDTAELPWTVDRYRDNPVVTWAHDFGGNRLPIGRADVEVIDAGAGEMIRANVFFDPQDEFAKRVEGKYRDGFLHAVSVSWDDVDSDGVPTRVSGGRAVAHDLLEIAAVPVPGDPDALIGRQAAALRGWAAEIEHALGDDAEVSMPKIHTGLKKLTAEQLREYEGYEDDEDFEGNHVETTVEYTLDDGAINAIADLVAAKLGDLPDEDEHDEDDEPVEDSPAQAVAEMVDALDPLSDDTDDERRVKYNRAAAKYRRLGMEAPELLTSRELRALDFDAWRDLFLEGEIPLRAGAVLNRANTERLQRAGRLIRAVLNSADSEIGEDDDDERALADALAYLRGLVPDTEADGE